jgi:hypothetical protein
VSPSSAGVIDYFLSPRFAFVDSSVTQPSLIPNPVSGRNNVFAASVGPGFRQSAYGVVFAVSLAPAHAGRSVATFPQYEDLAFELWVTHTLASGLVIVTQHEQSKESNGIILFQHLLPSSIVVDVFPHFEVTLEWLVGL